MTRVHTRELRGGIYFDRIVNMRGHIVGPYPFRLAESEVILILHQEVIWMLIINYQKIGRLKYKVTFWEVRL